MADVTYEPSGCNCDGTAYTQADINAAATKGLQLASQKQTLGRDKYPHAYNDYEHFTFSHAQSQDLPLTYGKTWKPYLEFPILQNGRVYDEESPGADRIVIGSISEDYESAVYCAVITHDGQKKNGFAECKDDSNESEREGGGHL